MANCHVYGSFFYLEFTCIYIYIYMDICNIICIQTILMACLNDPWIGVTEVSTEVCDVKTRIFQCLKPVRCCTLTILLGATDNTKQALLAPRKGTFIKAQFVRVCCITSSQITPLKQRVFTTEKSRGAGRFNMFFHFYRFFFLRENDPM